MYPPASYDLAEKYHRMQEYSKAVFSDFTNGKQPLSTNNFARGDNRSMSKTNPMQKVKASDLMSNTTPHGQMNNFTTPQKNLKITT